MIPILKVQSMHLREDASHPPREVFDVPMPHGLPEGGVPIHDATLHARRLAPKPGAGPIRVRRVQRAAPAQPRRARGVTALSPRNRGGLPAIVEMDITGVLGGFGRRILLVLIDHAVANFHEAGAARNVRACWLEGLQVFRRSFVVGQELLDEHAAHDRGRGSRHTALQTRRRRQGLRRQQLGRDDAGDGRGRRRRGEAHRVPGYGL
mmetsp:Transcript_81284/g.235721  ORF Transcript_81284/g.235721 Transcript_81284/m.235721 type:complete len:207 (-) Transcript_81284:295-915(-)